MKTIIILLLSTVFLAAGEKLTEKQLVELIAKPADEVSLIKELRIFAKPAVHKVSITNRFVGGKSSTNTNTSTSWSIEGKHLVSRLGAEGDDALYLVINYDEDSDCYRHYLLMKGKLFEYSEGLRFEGTRQISWIALNLDKEDKSQALTIETYTDDSYTWRTRFYENGKLLRIDSGESKAIEK